MVKANDLKEVLPQLSVTVQVMMQLVLAPTTGAVKVVFAAVVLLNVPPQEDVHWYENVLPGRGEAAVTERLIELPLTATCPLVIPDTFCCGAFAMPWKKLKFKKTLCAATSPAVNLL
jgi:hypothetical protein